MKLADLDKTAKTASMRRHYHEQLRTLLTDEKNVTIWVGYDKVDVTPQLRALIELDLQARIAGCDAQLRALGVTP